MREDEGSIAPVAAAIVGLAVLLAALVGGVGQAFIARNRAASAADAAALAAAAVTFRPFGSPGDPAAEADRFARLHGVELVSCDCPIDRSYAPRRVTVVVTVTTEIIGLGSRTFQATGRAVMEPLVLLGEPP